MKFAGPFFFLPNDALRRQEASVVSGKDHPGKSFLLRGWIQSLVTVKPELAAESVHETRSGTEGRETDRRADARQKSHGRGMEDAFEILALRRPSSPLFRIHKSEICKQARWENRATLTPPGKVNGLEHPVPA